MDAREAAAASNAFKAGEAAQAAASQPPPITDYFIERQIIPAIDKEIAERAGNGKDFVHWPVTNETKNFLIKHYETKGFKCKIHFSAEEFYPETGWMPATETLILSWNS